MTWHDDLVYVAWARDHAGRALTKVRGVAREEFVLDESRYLPLLVLLARMSESVSRISSQYRDDNPGVPWTEMAAVSARVHPDPFSDDPQAGWEIASGPLQDWHAALEALGPQGFGEAMADEVSEVAGAHGRSRGARSPRVEISRERLAELCKRHGVRRLRLYGSVLRDDFGPRSDVDLLVEFEPGADPSWRLPSVEQEFSAAFGGHSVEMVEPECLDKYIRNRVLQEAEEIYAA